MHRRSLAVAVGAVAATVLAAAAVFPDSARATAASVYVRGSEVAVPEAPLKLRAAPSSTRILGRVSMRTEFGSPTRLAVVGRAGEWLAVMSPALHNRVRGYVHRDDVELGHNPYSLEVDRSSRRLTVWRMGVPLRRVRVAIGARGSPTPIGRFAVTDKLRDFWPSLYGCCAIALSGHQTQLAPGWTGGDRLAIHEGSGLGWSVTNGCLRAGRADMRYLMARLPLGTQVVVHA